MSFFKRIGYGWLLVTESLFSIINQHTNLIKIAALILFGIFFSVSIFNSSSIVPIFEILSVASKNVPLFLATSFILSLIISFVFSLMYAALYIYFSHFLQERDLTFKAAVARVVPHLGYILLWVIVDVVIRELITRSVHVLPSWSYTLPSNITVSINISMLLTTQWSWMSLFVLASIVLDNTGVIGALKTSVRIAVQKIPELSGFGLWSITAGFLLLFIFGGSIYLLLSFPHGSWFLQTLGWYIGMLLIAVVIFAYALFIVALYLSSTGRLVSRLGRRDLQEYFLQQAQ